MNPGGDREDEGIRRVGRFPEGREAKRHVFIVTDGGRRFSRRLNGLVETSRKRHAEMRKRYITQTEKRNNDNLHQEENDKQKRRNDCDR